MTSYITRACSSVKAAVAAFTARNLPLHVLICNAGVFLPPHTKTQQGFEVRRVALLACV